MKNSLFSSRWLWLMASAFLMMSSPLKASSGAFSGEFDDAKNLKLESLLALKADVFSGSFGLNASALSTNTTYCSIHFLYYGIEPISRVVFADIDNASSASTAGNLGYEDFTSISTEVSLGEAYEISVEGNTGGNLTSYFNVFIDWNQNGTFEADEAYELGTLKNSNGLDGKSVNDTIVVPSDATLGSTRMRVVKKFNAYGTACDSGGFGQAEDYTLVVVDAATVNEETACFEEGFDELGGSNDNSNGSTNAWAGNANFPTVEKTFQAGNAVRLGTGSLVGSIESKVLDDVSGDVTVKIMVKGWSSVEGALVVQIDGQSKTATYTAKITDAFEEVILDFTGVVAGAKLKIATSAKRAFIDDVQVVCGASGPIDYSDPCGTKIIAECGVEYTATLVPNEGIWTNYTSVDYNYKGSEKVFEFTATSTGLHIFDVDQGENDADFFLMTACSNTAGNIISNVGGGYWTGEQSEYINLVAGTTYYLIADLNTPSAPTTVSVKINCLTDESITEPDFDCFQGDGITTDLDGALNLDPINNLTKVADDFIVAPGTTFTLRQITMDVNQVQVPDNAVMNIRADNGGKPGEILETINMAPSSSKLYAVLFNEPVYHLTFDLAEPLTFGEGTYWLEPKVTTPQPSTVWWVMTESGTHGSLALLSEDDGVTWETVDNYRAVFFVAGDCEDSVPPASEFACENQTVPSNNIQEALFFGNNQKLAFDIITDEAGYPIYGLELNVVLDGSTNVNFNFTLHDDQGGLPGAVVQTSNGSIYSNELIGNIQGYDVYKYVVKFETPMNLSANTTYWLEVSSDAFAWEAASVNTFGQALAFNNNTTSGDWAVDTEGFDLVYKVICHDLGLSDLNAFDFAYYPNPVRDVLNITSKVGVKSVEVFNLAGQNVLRTMKVSQGQVDVSALATGTYVFRATLENGQVETFKIVKK